MANNNNAQIRLVVGLGNPGSEYAGTRHNIGFMIVDQLVGIMSGEYESYSRYDSSILTGRCKGRNLWLQKPTTYMNLSGHAVRKLMTAEKISPEELLVVYDDMDITFGRLRMRKNGSSGGHRGMESIISELGSDKFSRLRVGIGQVEKAKVVDYVLSQFRAEEQPRLERVLQISAEAIKLSLMRGVSVAMNQYNGWSYDSEEEEKLVGKES